VTTGDDYTQNVLDAVKQQLTHSTNLGPLARISSLLRDDTISGSKQQRPRKLFGRSPWSIRKTSTASETSVSSSIRDLLRAHTPRNSPVQQPGIFLEDMKYEWTDQFPGGVRFACFPFAAS
jgi:hypothetical protein